MLHHGRSWKDANGSDNCERRGSRLGGKATRACSFSALLKWQNCPDDLILVDIYPLCARELCLDNVPIATISNSSQTQYYGPVCWWRSV